ncbi:MAG: hypothetical protein LBL21_00190 [Rickettsiales bacterium]|nr:hypothetical protein [Rickettsiales bacterium]
MVANAPGVSPGIIYLVVDGSQSAPNIWHALLSQRFPRESIIEIEQSAPDLYDVIRRDCDAGVCKGVIVSGSPRSVFDADATHLDRRVYDLPVPKLLICYAFQDAAFQLGGAVRPAAVRENGLVDLRLTGEWPLPRFDSEVVRVISNHGDEVAEPWAGAEAVGRTKDNFYAAVYDRARNIAAVQPHFEISPEAARCAFFAGFRKWTGFSASREFSAGAISDYIRADLSADFPLADGKNILLALSGGVDSTAVAQIASRHYGRDRVDLAFVDTGLLRYYYDGKGGFRKETDILRDLLARQFGAEYVHRIDARERFLSAIAKSDGFDNPDTDNGRRQAIGNEFAYIFADRIRDGGNKTEWFFQGTNQADKQESGRGRGKSDRIKTHHNEVPMLKTALASVGAKIAEPLHWLYKNDIIRVGEFSGLNMELYRQPPFPGPGMAVRIDGAVSPESLDGVCKAAAIFRRQYELGIESGAVPPLEPGYQTRQYFAAALNTATGDFPIDGEKTPYFKKLHAEARAVFLAGLRRYDIRANAVRDIALLNTISTTGQKGDGRVSGWQVEMRLFDRGPALPDIPEDALLELSRDLLSIREISRVAQALNIPAARMRGPDGRLSGKYEFTAVETKDFTALHTTRVGRDFWRSVMAECLWNKVGDTFVRAVGYKPGMTTERH